MGNDFGKERRDIIEEVTNRGEQSDEVVSDFTDVLNITEMGDGKDGTKMEKNVKNSTKNGQMCEVR
jgi:hypothetical protein